MLSALPPPRRPLNQPNAIDFIGSNCNMPRISPPATSPSPAWKKPSAPRGLTHPRASQRALPRPSAPFRESSVGAARDLLHRQQRLLGGGEKRRRLNLFCFNAAKDIVLKGTNSAKELEL